MFLNISSIFYCVPIWLCFFMIIFALHLYNFIRESARENIEGTV